MGTQKKMSLSIEFESHFQWVLSLGFELKLKTQTQYSNSFFFEYPCMHLGDTYLLELKDFGAAITRNVIYNKN